MLEPKEIHDKIIEILNEKGPTLPITLSKKIGMSSLFISAFLSELTDEKRIKVSHLKVGGSPLYFLDGQEEQLEKFYKYLHPRESEAFLLLKKNKILKDLEQEPAIRVALRSIRDFAIGFKKQDEIYWRYFSVPESEIKQTQKKQPKSKSRKQEKSTKAEKTRKTQKQEITFNNPLVIKTKKQKKEKPKSEFVQKIINILKNNHQIIEEKEFKAKEYKCLISINSDLGQITFLTQAKDKKTVSETDLKKLLSDAQSIPLPALFIYTGKLSKKAIEFAEKYFSVIKVRKVA
tara:strand:+ start:8386 stop:9255 length:870 start_codon:yes stop_codon:yes gene_type:complete